MCSASKAEPSSRKERTGDASYLLTFGGIEKPEMPSPAKSDDSPTRRTPRLFENPIEKSLIHAQKTCTFGGGIEESIASSESTFAPSNKSAASSTKKPF